MRTTWTLTLAATLSGLWIGSASAAAPAPGSLNSCVNACNASSLKEDDKATCKLECRMTYESPAPTPTPTPAPTTPPARTTAPAPTPAPARFDLGACESRCTVHMLDTDRATCRLQCRNRAESFQPAPTASSPAGPPAGTTGTGAPAGYTPTGVTGPGGSVMYSPTSSIAAPTPQGPSAANQQQLQACVDECHRQSYRSPTDAETCKLNCNNLAETWAPSTVYYGGGTSAANTREAVINSSAGVSGTAYPTPRAYWYDHQAAPQSPPAPTNPAVFTPTPPASPPPQPSPAAATACMNTAQQCGQGCTNEVSSCYRECSDTKGPATDKETCRLLCDSNREVCGQNCQTKAVACNKAATPSR